MAGLYAIVDPASTGGRDPLQLAQAILRGGCARLQLRWKDGPDRELLSLARRLQAACARRGTAFVMNDRPDLAVLAGADGLHLGQDDLPIAEARRIVGALEIGRSTHDEEQARAAIDEGADLIAFGPIFGTQSKTNPDPEVGIERLRDLCASLPIDVVAIGGIDPTRADAIRDAGARFGAAIGAVCKAEDPEAAARQLHRALGGQR